MAINTETSASKSWLDAIIRFCLENKVFVVLALCFVLFGGLIVAPFDWEIAGIVRSPVPVDAIPDIGENQQIVFSEWPGRSPQDVQNQITYPLSAALLGMPGVKSIRANSVFGFSSIYIIFNDNIEFYWSRSRILEKLNSLPPETLPQGVRPSLGPDATALGQVFWYTLEGRDEAGNLTGGWDLDELRTVQDWYVRYALMSARGVSEVASVGGFVKEYQIDVDPDAMRAYGVSLGEVFEAVKKSNVDVGARTIEINRVEYVIRGLGFIRSVEDIEDAAVAVNQNVPVYVRNVADVTLGPAMRRGALDKEGAETVGGVVVVRFGENPLAVIKNVKDKINEIAPGLPTKALPDGTVSRVTIVPFYDRTQLINETLGTLNTALIQEVVVTVIVVVILVGHLRSSALIAGTLPMAILMCFIAMRAFGVDANIVALSGIAIAIGTMVDMGIVICENILQHLARAKPGEDRLEVVFRAASEVGGAVLTAVATTVVGFLPVFAMQQAEGKLFRPLAFTKTFALAASVILSITAIPPLAYMLFAGKEKPKRLRCFFYALVLAAGVVLLAVLPWWIGFIVALTGAYNLLYLAVSESVKKWLKFASYAVAVAVVGVFLTRNWLPLGPEKGLTRNLAFVTLLIGGLLCIIYMFRFIYSAVLRFCLEFKALFMLVPILIVLAGARIWAGLGKEFMPPLDEGTFLLMPTTMPHASIGEALDILKKQDIAIRVIPEVDTVVGKIGRAESPLDPAPISMVETVINYKPKYLTDDRGRRLTFKYEPEETDLFRAVDGTPVPAPDGEPYNVRGRFERDSDSKLIPQRGGTPFRLWRPALSERLNRGRASWPGVRKPDDIWDLIVEAASVPGTTTAPRLQPIETRIVMLQTGMRAPMGVKVRGPDLETIEKVALDIERFLKEVPSVKSDTVNADRIVGKPYLEIHYDRRALGRYGIKPKDAQQVVEVAVGGKPITTTVEGRERYPVRVRYMRELRDSLEALKRILVPAPDGTQIPLSQVAEVKYARGPDVIKSEDTFPVAYVTFDRRPGYAEVEVVQEAKAYLAAKRRSRELNMPAGTSFRFAGTYENQVRAEQRLKVVVPVALFLIFMILHLHFKSVPTALFVFSGILVAWAGGFILIWLYGRPWFLDFTVFGRNMRDLFQVHPINLSVAVWVGFLALFGIASDDGVVMATYLRQTFAARSPNSIRDVRSATVEAGARRARPCLMTSATTILALIPVLTSQGRGADIMIPMAIPAFGGMLMVIISIFIVPVLYCFVEEIKLKPARGWTEKSRPQ